MRRNASLFVLISLLSGFGSTAMTLAAGVWILDLTGSVGMAALIGVCLYAPTYASPWLGVLVDRLPRRPLLIVSDLILGAAMLSLLAVDAAGGVWWIFAVLLVRGVGYVVQDAGETAILPAALPSSALGDVNGWRTSAQEGMKLLAPLAGAGLYAWRGPTPVIVLSAVLPLLSAGCYALLRLARISGPSVSGGSSVSGGPSVSDGPSLSGGPSGSGAPPKAGVELGETGEEGGLSRPRGGRSRPTAAWAGFAFLFRDAAVRVPVLAAAAAIALSGLTNAAVFGQLVHGLHLPATHLGILASAQGAGSIVGGMLVGRLLARTPSAVVAAIGAALFAAGCVAWSLPWWAAMITGSVLVGVGLPWALVAGVTAVQLGTPEELLGRVGATSTMVMFGPVAVAIPAGALLVQFGARVPLVAGAVLALSTAAVAVRAHRRLPARATTVG